MGSITLFLSLIACLASNFSNGLTNKKIFRKDYDYLGATESFYKIHTLPRTWREAKRMCVLEGASLFYPQSYEEAETVRAYWNATQPFIEVFIGVSDLIAKGVYETIDGKAIRDVYHKWAPGEPNDAYGNEDCILFSKDSTLNDASCIMKFPFICKKNLASLEWNQECNIPYLDYQFNEKLGRCYKFHLKPKSWTDAHTVCSAELSYLAVINSKQEADYLAVMTESAPKNNVTRNFMTGIVLLGFHDRYNEGWETVKGTSLEDSGYTIWGNGQPDGVNGVNERCGSMLYNGQLNEIRCNQRSFFICEHEIDRLSTDVIQNNLKQ